MLNATTIQEKVEIVKDSANNEHFNPGVGFRVLPKASPAYNVGELMDNSMQWDDDACTGEELAGACCISVDHPDALNLISGYHDGVIYIVTGESFTKGLDVGELIIKNPVVSGILEN
jgi:hypothetical protein